MLCDGAAIYCHKLPQKLLLVCLGRLRFKFMLIKFQIALLI